MSNKVFLSHIGGLRGIAIILVILFHLCPALFPNCYYGVDIFLVITGYLLFLGLNRHDGTLKGTGVFALKKAERILPPLSIAVLLTVLAGMYFLDKTLLEATARLGRYALFGLANNHLNKVISNYFDTTAAQNPLLHTWYIGITLQVYLLFALGVMVSKRISAKAALHTLVGIGVFSLCWKYRMDIQSLITEWTGIAGTDMLVPPTHYDTLPRLWEVLAGGLIILLPKSRNEWLNLVLVLVGLAGISTAFYLPNAEPIAVLGTVLVIAYGGDSKAKFILSNKLMMSVGAVSFSLYLVHMPVFTFYKSWIVTDPTLYQYIDMGLMSLVFGVAFWYLVEKRKFNWKVWVAIWSVTMLLCVLTKKTSIINDALTSGTTKLILKPYNDWHVTPAEDMMRHYDAKQLIYWGGLFSMSDTAAPKNIPDNAIFHLGDESKAPNFVMMGDSHAASMYPGFDHICRKANQSGVYIPTIISPFWNYEVQMDERYFCNRAKMEALLSWLQKQPTLKYVVVIQRWYQRCKVNKYDWNKQKADLSLEAHTESLREFLRQMQQTGKQVILVDQIPDFNTNARTYTRWCLRRDRNPADNIAPFLCSKERYVSRHRDYLKMLDTVEDEGLCRVLSFDKALENDGNFVSYANGDPLYRDDNHPATPGAIYYMEKIASDFFHLLDTSRK